MLHDSAKGCLVGGLILATMFTVAFRSGDLVELQKDLRESSSRGIASVVPSTQEIQLIVPRMTRGKVLSVRPLKSGDYGVEMEVEPGSLAGAGVGGQKLWVLYRPGASALKLTPATADPRHAQFAETLKDMPALSRWVNPISESVASTAEAGGPAVTMTSAPIDLQQMRSQAEQARWLHINPRNLTTPTKGRGLATDTP